MLDRHLGVSVEPAEVSVPFDDPECSFTAMPQSVWTFVPPPRLDLRDSPSVGAILSRLTANLKAGGTAIVALPDDDPKTRATVEEILGAGESRILADRCGERLIAEEAVFAGVWKIKRYAGGQFANAYLETGAFPSRLTEWLARQESGASFPAHFPDNLMNAPALLYEVFAKSRTFVPGMEEVVNLTLLPLTPEDMAFVRESLGFGDFSILIGGYGDCRIRQTGLRNVWWVQYFNSTEQLILNTLELTVLPKLALAAPEDLEDSIARLESLCMNAA